MTDDWDLFVCDARSLMAYSVERLNTTESRLAQLVERVTSNVIQAITISYDEVSRSSRLVGIILHFSTTTSFCILSTTTQKVVQLH